MTLCRHVTVLAFLVCRVCVRILGAFGSPSGPRPATGNRLSVCGGSVSIVYMVMEGPAAVDDVVVALPLVAG